jgi:hypothetical protein
VYNFARVGLVVRSLLSSARGFKVEKCGKQFGHCLGFGIFTGCIPHIFVCLYPPEQQEDVGHLIGDIPPFPGQELGSGFKFKVGAGDERVHSFKTSSHTRSGVVRDGISKRNEWARPTHRPFLIIPFAARDSVPRAVGRSLREGACLSGWLAVVRIPYYHGTSLQ